MSALELSEAYRGGELSPVDVFDSLITRIKELNPVMNSIVTLDEDRARRLAKDAEAAIKRGEEKGPLHGIPIALKDATEAEGMRITYGSKLLANHVSKKNSVSTARLQKAGGIILGTTNISDLSVVISTTHNLVVGSTLNPWDTTRSSGGSCGGAAAALASGMAPLATATDGWGSLRIPACFCGVYGIKPSIGRIPLYPSVAGWETLITEGCITRTVSDAALYIDAARGYDMRSRTSLPNEKGSYLEGLKDGVEGIKFAYSPNLGHIQVDPEIAEITRKAAFAFQKLGCDVTEIGQEFPDLRREMLTLVCASAHAAFPLKKWRDEMDPLFWEFPLMKETFTVRDYIRAEFSRGEVCKVAKRVFDDCDFLLTPMAAIAPFKIDERGGPMGPSVVAGKSVDPMSWTDFVYPFNFTTQPAATVPCGFTKEGLPVGLQIVGKHFDDAGLLRASYAFEQAFQWRERKPSLKANLLPKNEVNSITTIFSL